MTILHIHLLGQLRLFWDDQPYPFKALPKVEPILAYLLLHQEAPLARDTFAFKLWPDVTEKQALGRLRRHLYDLRRALPAPDAEQPWLLITAQTVQWNPAAPYWLDVAAFSHLSQQPNRCAEAIALYTGPLLPDIDETWLFLAREHLHRQFLQTLAALIQQNWQQQDYQQALIYTQQALAEDGLNEAIMRQQMALYYVLGDRATAVQVYHAFVAALYTQLEVTPLPETTAVYTAIQENQPAPQICALAGFTEPDPLPAPSPLSPPRAAVAHNLPLSLRPMIGRQQEVQEVAALLTAAGSARLVTLTGAAGIGKTRLALTVAHHLTQRHALAFPDGVFLVSLAPINDETRLPEAVAAVLGTKPKPNQTYLDALWDYLRYKQLLLILDNFEHVVEAALTVATLLKTIPGLQVMVTSQIPLDLYGEQEYPVRPLQLPDSQAALSLAELQETEAVALFVAAAQMARPGFAITADNAAPISEICVRLDGLPLAIELAAARCKHYSPAQLLSQLQDNLALLTSRYRDVSARHQTLQAAIQWSFDLLDEEAKALFIRLSLFAHGFSPTAVAHIILETADTNSTTEKLLALAERSLIYPLTETQAEGEQRLAMLHTIRLFALTKWEDLPDKTALQKRYLDYYATVLEPVRKAWHSQEQGAWNQWIAVEEENIRQALAWSIGESRLPQQTETGIIITAALAAGYWEATAKLKEAVRTIQLADKYLDDVPLKTAVRFLQTAGLVADVAGLADEVAFAYRERALARAYQTQDEEMILYSLDSYGATANRRGDFARAESLLTKALALIPEADAGGLRYRQASIMMNLSISLSNTQDDLEKSLDLQERSTAIVRSLKRPSDLAKCLLSLANTYRNLGRLERAAACLREGFQIGQEIDNKFAQILLLGATANYAYAQERIGQTVQIYGAFLTLSQKLNIQWTPYYQREFADALTDFRQLLGPERFEINWSKGAAMSLDQVITFVHNEVI